MVVMRVPAGEERKTEERQMLLRFKVRTGINEMIFINV